MLVNAQFEKHIRVHDERKLCVSNGGSLSIGYVLRCDVNRSNVKLCSFRSSYKALGNCC